LKVIIRAASGVDAEEILALQKLAYESEAALYGDWSIPPLIQTLESLREEFARSIVLRAEVDGRIVGSVRASMEGGACSIARLMVHPDFQGQGIGSALLRAIEGIFPDVARYVLFTGDKSRPTIRLYQQHGYEITRTEAQTPAVMLVHLEKPGGARPGLGGPVGSRMTAPCPGDCGLCAASPGKRPCAGRGREGGMVPHCFLCSTRVCGEAPGTTATPVPATPPRDRWSCLECGASVCLQQRFCIFCGRAREWRVG
jgi:ribosomal protein S18 acetylase RimI-like enzyme